MMQTYQAELNGSQLIWLEEPPTIQTRKRVWVVLERPERDDVNQGVVDYSKAFVQARGCMGSIGRQDALRQLEQLRSDWDRNPIQTPDSHGTAGRG